MVIFLDTSSLVKLYYSEADSETLLEKITEKVSEIYLFELCKVEFTSALWKKVRIGTIDKMTCERVPTLFDEDEKNYEWIVFDSELVEAASNLFEKYGLTSLRTLDSLQLAAAMKVRDLIDAFITDDDLLKKLFEKEGLNTQF